MAHNTNLESIHFKNDGPLKPPDHRRHPAGDHPPWRPLSTSAANDFDTILAHTGQNYDYTLNGIFFHDLGLADPDIYLDAVGDDLRQTMGTIIARSYELMIITSPMSWSSGDTNSCLSVIGAKRLHIPIFHMEAGNRCKDECLPEETNRCIVDIISDVNMAYSEQARTIWPSAVCRKSVPQIASHGGGSVQEPCRH